MRSGGDSRVAGIMLAAATFGILVVGPVIIGFILIMVVGALIFFLGVRSFRNSLCPFQNALWMTNYGNMACANDYPRPKMLTSIFTTV